MVQAIIWEVLQWRASLTIAESGKIIGGEMHKSKIAEKNWGGRDKGSNEKAKIAFFRTKLIYNSTK